MRLELTVPAHLYPQLKDERTRRAFERELALVCTGPVRVEAMRDGPRRWVRGSNGHKRKVSVGTLPEEALVGLTCSLSGG